MLAGSSIMRNYIRSSFCAKKAGQGNNSQIAEKAQNGIVITKNYKGPRGEFH